MTPNFKWHLDSSGEWRTESGETVADLVIRLDAETIERLRVCDPVFSAGLDALDEFMNMVFVVECKH